MRTDKNLFQRAEILVFAVMLALRHRTLNGTVCATMTIHDVFLLHPMSKVVCAFISELFEEKIDRCAQIAYNHCSCPAW